MTPKVEYFKQFIMISILIADDQNIVREGIKIFLEPCEEIEIIGMAKDGEETLKQVEKLKPDILLLDVEMPLGNGIDICHQISHKFPQTKTILLSSHEEKIYIQQGIKAGAKGYILKTTASEELNRAIKLVHMGYSVFESKVLQKLIRKNPPPSASEYAQVNLRPKEEIGRRNGTTTDNDLAVEKLEPVVIKDNVDPYLDANSATRNDLVDNHYLRDLHRRRPKKSSTMIQSRYIHVWNLCLAILLIIIIMAVIFMLNS